LAPGLSMSRPGDLPDFRNPPLVETVLSLQFEPIEGLTAAHVGLLWQRFRKDLPLIEEYAPLAPVVETFGPPSPPQAQVTIEERPPAPRLWFLNEAKSELIQVQSDRFIQNWRRTAKDQPYPRFEPIREKFRQEVSVFEQFLKDEGFQPLQVNQCEVTYVNHIEPGAVWESHGQLEKVVRVWAGIPDPAFLPEPENAAATFRFIMRDETRAPLGRLHVVVQPAWRKTDNVPILTLNLTARGAPLSEGIDGAFAFFDLGREWIVKGFADLTTPEMHTAWGRSDA